VLNYYTFSLAAILLAGTSLPARAQDSQPPAEPVANAQVEQEGVISFTPADFAASRPNTALDMINRMPGFELDGGDSVRGFAGAAGNVLIDGQRPTTKSEGVGDILSRITIDQVERIDLIRGGAPGIDMQGKTVVVNVIRKKTDTFQQVFSARVIGFTDTGHTLPGWNYQATRRVGEHQFDFSLGRGISMDDSSGFGWRTLVDPATGAGTFQDATNEGDGVVHTARANYKGPLAGGTLSLNGLLSTDEFKSESHYFNTTSDEQYVNRSHNDRGEIGVNFTTKLTPELELEALALSKLAVGEGDSTGNDNGSTSAFSVEAEAGETIGRSVLRYRLSPELQFEGGGEVAFNYREQQVALTIGGTPIPLPASDVRVEELRGEVFAQGTWRPSPQWTLEAGVRLEQSTITQSGDTNQERSFTYPKPRLVATWSPAETDQLRLRAERIVGQLNFQDFASNVNLSSNVLSAGNANLEPNKTWVYEAAYEKRFWEDAALVLTVRHEDISDVIDLFPFTVLVDANNDGVPDDANNDGQPDQRLVAGPGNIGDGTNDVVQLNLTLPLEKLGVSGAEVRVSTLWQNSEVTDPLTGEKRRISSQRPDDISVNYRQDLPDLNLSYGFTWFGGWAETEYQLEEVTKLRLNQFYGSFIEWKPNPGFTLRGEINNFLPYRFNIIREAYDGPRGPGSALELVETQRRNSQVLYQVSGRWTF
jgi:hypothetical protein